MSTIINTERLDQEIDKIELMYLAAKRFREERLNTIKNNSPLLEQFISKFTGYDLVIENMYKSGIGDGMYDNSQLIVHCQFKLSKEFKNKDLLAKKLTESFKEILKDTKLGIGWGFKSYNMINGIVKFEMYVK